MNKKTYIVPQIISEHAIMADAIADVPVYGETGSTTNSGGLVKEHNEEFEKNDDWGDVATSIW
jgi:translation initiation factor 6 (eIF-6)